MSLTFFYGVELKVCLKKSLIYGGKYIIRAFDYQPLSIFSAPSKAPASV
jgi:hypothetical protein